MDFYTDTCIWRTHIELLVIGPIEDIYNSMFAIECKLYRVMQVGLFPVISFKYKDPWYFVDILFRLSKLNKRTQVSIIRQLYNICFQDKQTLSTPHPRVENASMSAKCHAFPVFPKVFAHAH